MPPVNVDGVVRCEQTFTSPWTFCTRTNSQQECIPVGCVPAASRPYVGVCFQGVYLLRGVPGLGGSAPRRVPGPGGFVYSRGGGCLVRGVCSRGGIPACTEADTPPTPVDRHTLVKILPWPNFVAAGNKQANYNNGGGGGGRTRHYH